MANSIDHQLDQELQCSICNELFKDPRMLPCQDTFCLECLESVSKLTNGKAIDCSLCKRTHDLPMEDGAKGFPENMLMKSLLNMKKTLANAPPSGNLMEDDCNTTLIGDHKTGQKMDKFESEVKQIIAEAKEEIMVKFESDAKKILADFEAMIKYGPEKNDTKKSSDISGFFSKYFWSLFFLWLCLIIVAISLILIGKHYGSKQDNDRTGPTGSSIPIGLQIEGTSFLLLALTFPLIYRVSLIFQRIDPVLARYSSSSQFFFF